MFVAQYMPSLNPCIKQAKYLDENVTSSSWSIFSYLMLLCTHGRNTEYKQAKNPGLTPNHPHLPACSLTRTCDLPAGSSVNFNVT